MWQEDLPPFLQRDPKKIAHKSLAGLWDLYYTRFVVSTIFIGTLSHFLDWRKLDDSYILKTQQKMKISRVLWLSIYQIGLYRFHVAISVVECVIDQVPRWFDHAMALSGNRRSKSSDKKKTWGWVKTLVPLVNIKIAGKWMFIPLKMVCIGIDP